MYFFWLFFFTHSYIPFQQTIKKGEVGKLETKKKLRAGEATKKGRGEGMRREQRNLNVEKYKPLLNEMGNRAKRNDSDG